MLIKKCLESFPIPETKERKGSGGGTNCGNFTLPSAQHNPVDSLVYLNALQYLQIISFPQLLPICRHTNQLPDHSGMQLVQESQEHCVCGFAQFHYV